MPYVENTQLEVKAEPKHRNPHPPLRLYDNPVLVRVRYASRRDVTIVDRMLL